MVLRLPPIPPATLNLAENVRLTNAVYIAHNNIVGPETLAFSAKGEMYTGLMNGDIVRVDVKTGNITKVTRIGPETDDAKCCNLFFKQ